MKIEHPETGQQLEINPQSEYRMPSEGQLQIPRELDRVPDGVLRMDDRPEGVPEGKWKSFLTETFSAVQAQYALKPAWDAYGVQAGKVWRSRREIDDAVEQAAANKTWDKVAELLQGTGLRVEPRWVAQAGSVRIHQVFRGTEDIASIQVPWRASPAEIARLAKEAAGL